MHKDLKGILVNEGEIQKHVAKLAGELNRDYKDKEVILILVLKGSVVFCADLMRKLDLRLIMSARKLRV